MYGCESWSLNKKEREKIYSFEMWCWRRLLRVPWTAKRTNHSTSLIFINHKEIFGSHGSQIKTDITCYFGQVMRTRKSLEKSIMISKNEGKRRRPRTRRIEAI